MLVSTDGPLHNVLKIKPPLPFSPADADRLVNELADVLAEDAAQPYEVGGRDAVAGRAAGAESGDLSKPRAPVLCSLAAMTFASDIRLTYFADPERTPAAVLERQQAMLIAQPLVTALLDSFPGAGGHHQPPAADRAGATTSCSRSPRRATESCSVIRIGEALGCQHGRPKPAGCGTTPACAVCGAAKAIQQTQATRKRRAPRSAGITLSPERGHESLDSRRRGPRRFDVEGEPFTVFAVRDTSADQRRRVLERMFFHDRAELGGRPARPAAAPAGPRGRAVGGADAQGGAPGGDRWWRRSSRSATWRPRNAANWSRGPSP